MTAFEKLDMLKTMMHIEGKEEDEVLAAYLTAAGREIISWRYSNATERPVDVPQDYEVVQVFAVINGFSQIGAEGQTKHSEGSIERIFKYDTMVSYIRSHVIPIVRCI